MSGLGQILVALAAYESGYRVFHADVFRRNLHYFAATVLLGLVLGLQLSFELFCLFPTPSLRTPPNEGAVRTQEPVDPLRAAAALVIDVVRSAGRVVARVNGQHEFGLFAKSVVRLLYDFTYAL